MTHFLLRLPVSMRDHLAAKDHKTAAEMAKHADTLWAQGRVTQVSPPPSTLSPSASPAAATTLPVEATTATIRPAGLPKEAADYTRTIRQQTLFLTLLLSQQAREEGLQV
jgi:guanyl-specific ribonuclease Sa